MSNLEEQIDICLEYRQKAVEKVARALKDISTTSESGLSNHLQENVYRDEFHKTGWYTPPPAGVGVLFANKNDNYERSKFPTLRTEPYWPNPRNMLHDDTVATIYVSPVVKQSGIISDFSTTIYRGHDERIQNHLKSCLDATEAVAEAIEIGMKLKDVHGIGEKIIHERGLENSIMITFNDPTKDADYGHTTPWTYELPSDEELAIIRSDDFDKLASLISHKRIYLNSVETFEIPENIAFSIEPRLCKIDDPTLPASCFYTLVTFRGGQKIIASNANPIFDAVGIHYMKSRH